MEKARLHEIHASTIRKLVSLANEIELHKENVVTVKQIGEQYILIYEK